MRLFRITTQRDRAAAFDGVGASLYPGRWNERGRRVIYTTSRLPLGVLEVLVQSSLAALAGFVAYPLDVPDDALSRRRPHAALDPLANGGGPRRMPRAR